MEPHYTCMLLDLVGGSNDGVLVCLCRLSVVYIKHKCACVKNDA